MLSYSQKTYVPDDILEAWFEANGYGDSIAYNDSVLTSSINTITNLYLAGKYISDATGIEAIQSLQDLTIAGNSLTSLDLSNMPNLDYINFSNNPLTNVVLRDNLNLEDVYGGGGSCDSLDLRGCTDLYEVYIQNSNLHHILLPL